MPCWTDLETPDVQSAQAFYAAVLGWSYPALDEAGYATAETPGGTAAGIGPIANTKQTPAWTLYFASDDVDETARAIVTYGGTLVVDPGDVGSLGRLLIASDPAGGVFGVWQGGTQIGATVVNEPGALVWEDLRSTDPDAARRFYGDVFRHDFQALPMAGPDYFTFHLIGDKSPLGGMGGMFGAPQGTPSHWLVYFAVADTDATASAAERAGGKVIAAPFDSPFGRLAGIVDPAGAVFWVIQPNDSTQPDRSG
jgi:predicted enzyme related to lactoylglutathione lyase